MNFPLKFLYFQFSALDERVENMSVPDENPSETEHNTFLLDSVYAQSNNIKHRRMVSSSLWFFIFEGKVKRSPYLCFQVRSKYKQNRVRSK